MKVIDNTSCLKWLNSLEKGIYFKRLDLDGVYIKTGDMAPDEKGEKGSCFIRLDQYDEFYTEHDELVMPLDVTLTIKNISCD